MQSAVTAAEAATSRAIPTIEICPGTYQEQVTITKSLNVVHAPRSGRVTIEELAAPVGSTSNCQATDTASQVPQSVVEICGAKPGGKNGTGVMVSMSRVTVEGDWPANVCNDNLYGILVEGGAALNLTASVVQNVGADPLTSAGGCQGGVGVEAGYSYTNQSGHVLLDHVTVRGYQKNGVTADGAGSTALVANSTVTGAGATPYIAQNGIQISTGARGLVTSSGYVGDQAGVSDTGNRDTICHNKISGAGYAPREKASSLPNPPKPAWVRPVDIYSFAAAIHPQVSGNRYDGKPYNP